MSFSNLFSAKADQKLTKTDQFPGLIYCTNFLSQMPSNYMSPWRRKEKVYLIDIDFQSVVNRNLTVLLMLVVFNRNLINKSITFPRITVPKAAKQLIFVLLSSSNINCYGLIVWLMHILFYHKSI